MDVISWKIITESTKLPAHFWSPDTQPEMFDMFEFKSKLLTSLPHYANTVHIYQYLPGGHFPLWSLACCRKQMWTSGV